MRKLGAAFGMFLLGGCTFDIGPINFVESHCGQLGAKGRVWLGYQRPPALLPIGAPCVDLSGRDLRVGTTGAFSARFVDRAPVVAVRSSAPEVAEFTLVPPPAEEQPAQIVATGVRVGSADVLLLDAAGVEVDRGTLQVAAATGLALEPPELLFLSGGSADVTVTAQDAKGEMAGAGAMRFSGQGGLVVEGQPPRERDAVRVRADGPGQLSAECEAARLTAQVTTVEAAELTKIERFPEDGKLVEAAMLRVLAGDRLVRGALCTWSIEPPGPQPQPADTRTLPGLTIYRFSGAQGTYQATCTIAGGLSTTFVVVLK